jgi:Skp family chaperone for outer membrane proteins
MKTVSLLFAFLFVAISCLVSTSAFAPKANVARAFLNSGRVVSGSPTKIMAAFDDDKERNALTRDTEPDEYFQT